MGTKLFIGNLSFRTSEETLREWVSQIGEVVSVRIITDRETGRSRGFGFVEYTNEADAQKAIETLHEQELDGRNIIVREASEEKPRTGGFGGGNRSGGYQGGNRGGNSRGGFSGGNRSGGFSRNDGADRSSGFGGGRGRDNNRGGGRGFNRGRREDSNSFDADLF